MYYLFGIVIPPGKRCPTLTGMLYPLNVLYRFNLGAPPPVNSLPRKKVTLQRECYLSTIGKLSHLYSDENIPSMPGNVSQPQGNAFLPLKECYCHCNPGECCLNRRGVVSSLRKFYFPFHQRECRFTSKWILSHLVYVVYFPVRSTEREKKRKSSPAPLSGAHTDIWLEREDLGTSLLLCPGKMFRQGN